MSTGFSSPLEPLRFMWRRPPRPSGFAKRAERPRNRFSTDCLSSPKGWAVVIPRRKPWGSDGKIAPAPKGRNSLAQRVSAGSTGKDHRSSGGTAPIAPLAFAGLAALRQVLQRFSEQRRQLVEKTADLITILPGNAVEADPDSEPRSSVSDLPLCRHFRLFNPDSQL